MSTQELFSWARTTRWFWGTGLSAAAVASILLSVARVATQAADLPTTTVELSRRVDALEHTDSVFARKLNDIDCYVRVSAKMPGYSLERCALR